MLQKIENLFVKVYNYIKKHFSAIVIWFLALTTLFLLGDRFGWNESISKKANDLFGYLNTRKTIAVNLVLAIGSTISAIFAVVISIRANKISKKGLQSDRPIIVAEYNDGGANEKILKISNDGQLDAENIRVFVIKSKNEFYELEEFKGINLVSRAGKLEVNISNFEKLTTFIIFYQSSVLEMNYKYGFEILKKEHGIRQIGLQEDSQIDYLHYRNFEGNL